VSIKSGTFHAARVLRGLDLTERVRTVLADARSVTRVGLVAGVPAGVSEGVDHEGGAASADCDGQPPQRPAPEVDVGVPAEAVDPHAPTVGERRQMRQVGQVRQRRQERCIPSDASLG
jgi:hypothetical protein